MFLRSGDFMRARKLGEQAKEIYKNMQTYNFLALDYLLISHSCFYLGLFSEGMENATRGVELVKERELKNINYANLLMVSCLNAAAMGKISDAIKYGNESLKIFQDMGERRGQAHTYYALCYAYVKSGNPLAAEECARSGLKAIKGLTLPLIEGLLKWSLVRLLLEKRLYRDARPLMNEAEKLLKNSKFGLSMIYFSWARFYWEQKEKGHALNKLQAGLQLSKANQYEAWIVSEKHWIIPLLIEIYAAGKMKDYIEGIFSKISYHALKELALLQNNTNPLIKKATSDISEYIKSAPPPSITVFSLGKFRVFRGEEEIPPERWKSKKAKMLFKYLLFSRSRGFISREILMELLWPEEDPAKSRKRLHDALYSLRKTIEPEITRGALSSYIMREEDSYQLNPGEEGWVDVDEFRSELRMAVKEEKNTEQSILHYMKAEALYQGNFLEEDLFVEWSMNERDSLREKYMRLLEKIIGYYNEKRDYTKCIEYANKYLDVDNCEENIYQQLMNFYSLTGNTAMVNKTFERCKENIKKELDYSLSDETVELYRELVL